MIGFSPQPVLLLLNAGRISISERAWSLRLRFLRFVFGQDFLGTPKCFDPGWDSRIDRRLKQYLLNFFGGDAVSQSAS